MIVHLFKNWAVYKDRHTYDEDVLITTPSQSLVNIILYPAFLRIPHENEDWHMTSPVNQLALSMCFIELYLIH